MSPRLLFLVIPDWYFWSHRRALAKVAQSKGFEVYVACHVEEHAELIKGENFHLIPLKLRRCSSNPLRELIRVFELTHIYRKIQPTIVHHVGIKSIIYGSVAARITRVPVVVNALAGLGHVFTSSVWKEKCLRFGIQKLMRIALAGEHVGVIFQNPEDLARFVHAGLVPRRRATLIRGSGVDNALFVPAPEPPGVPIVLFASRLLWSKGAGQVVQAARRLKAEGTTCRVVLAGRIDHESPDAIPLEQIREWEREEVIEYWGLCSDMPDVLKRASIVVLPSFYGEGVPRILLEAASAGRPIIATDLPGCREIVRQGRNGILVPPRDADALLHAIIQLILNRDLRRKMGEEGRRIAIKEFSQEITIRETLALYQDLLSRNRKSDWPFT